MRDKGFFLIPVIVLCLQTASADESDIQVRPSASVYYQIGQLVKTFDPALTLPDKTWDQRCDMRLYLSVRLQERLRIIAGAELAMVTQVQPPRGSGQQGTTNTQSFAFPREGQGIYTFGDDPENSPLEIALGYFPFKYNPQASNMGEYLFRTGTYPAFIINDFDNCEARLLGLRASSMFFGSLRTDVLFTSETYYNPLGDYSLSFLAGYKVKKLLDMGAGISLSRLVPLDPKQTTPHNAQNIIYENDGMTPATENGDTLYYTYKGTKVMVRGSIDPKQFFSSPAFFGPEDGKLYFETIILGLENQGTYFNDVMRRWPYMIGFNIPAFRVLDLLSLEMEYFDSDYDQFSFPPSTTSPKENIGSDNWAIESRFHWSLFAQKTVVKGLSIKGLVGKDHYRNTGSTTPWAGVDNPVGTGSNVGGGELLIARGDWHYSIRVMYSF